MMEIATNTEKYQGIYFNSLAQYRLWRLIEEIKSRDEFYHKMRILRHYELQEELFMEDLMAKIVNLSNYILCEARHQALTTGSVAASVCNNTREWVKQITESKFFWAVLTLLAIYLTLSNNKPISYIHNPPTKRVNPDKLLLEPQQSDPQL